MTYSPSENGSGGIPCPACDHRAPFTRYTEDDGCPSCGTALRTLLHREDGGRP